MALLTVLGRPEGLFLSDKAGKRRTLSDEGFKVFLRYDKMI